MIEPALCVVSSVGAGVGVGLAGRCSARRRAEAVARACHELRGPLTALRLGLPLLAPTDFAVLELELDRAGLALDDLEHALRRRSAAPNFTRAPVEMSCLLAESVTAAGGRAASAGVTLSHAWNGPEAIVWGDRIRLTQALGNLIANAIEHGGGRVAVAGELRGGSVRLLIEDDGPGLPASVESIVRRRPQAGRRTRGRGLSITRRIAQAHSGTLRVAPVGRGGRVALELPGTATD